jgi:ERF superfamily
LEKQSDSKTTLSNSTPIDMLNLLPALIKAKQAFAAIPKDKKGNYDKYSSLDAVLAATEPALLENGLILSHQISEGCLRTILYHSSGELIESVIKLPEIPDPQKVGSAITYYRRYSICCLLSVCADEDDDGSTATALAKASAAAIRHQPVVATEEREIAAQRAIMMHRFQQLGWSKEEQKDWAFEQNSGDSKGWSLDVWIKMNDVLKVVPLATKNK